jgi:hypothetical protein
MSLSPKQIEELRAKYKVGSAVSTTPVSNQQKAESRISSLRATPEITTQATTGGFKYTNTRSNISRADW